MSRDSRGDSIVWDLSAMTEKVEKPVGREIQWDQETKEAVVR